MLEFRNPHADEHERVGGLSGHLAANAHLYAAPFGGVHHAFYYPQDGRMKRLVKIGDVLVHPVYGQRILQEVVCAYGKKSASSASISAISAAEGISIMAPTFISSLKPSFLF